MQYYKDYWEINSQFSTNDADWDNKNIIKDISLFLIYIPK